MGGAVRLQARLQRLERRIIAERGTCPACRERHGHTVFIRSRRQPDGTVVSFNPEPEPCARCGEIPELVIQIIEVVVANREEALRLKRELGQATALHTPSECR